nr:hypothetical protein A152_06135 [Vibrio tasmaniensis 1F-187]
MAKTQGGKKKVHVPAHTREGKKSERALPFNTKLMRPYRSLRLILGFLLRCTFSVTSLNQQSIK